jgi:hypothetical protein
VCMRHSKMRQRCGKVRQRDATNLETLSCLFQTNGERSSLGAVSENQYYFCRWKTTYEPHRIVGSILVFRQATFKNKDVAWLVIYYTYQILSSTYLETEEYEYLAPSFDNNRDTAEDVRRTPVLRKHIPAYTQLRGSVRKVRLLALSRKNIGSKKLQKMVVLVC